jgi:hypothetical protein
MFEGGINVLWSCRYTKPLGAHKQKESQAAKLQCQGVIIGGLGKLDVVLSFLVKTFSNSIKIFPE